MSPELYPGWRILPIGPDTDHTPNISVISGSKRHASATSLLLRAVAGAEMPLR